MVSEWQVSEAQQKPKFQRSQTAPVMVEDHLDAVDEGREEVGEKVKVIEEDTESTAARFGALQRSSERLR